MPKPTPYARHPAPRTWADVGDARLAGEQRATFAKQLALFCDFEAKRRFETTVDFLRFGRVALVYMALDESQAGVWSQGGKTWVPVDPSLQSSIRAGLKIARKQTAPDLIELPLPAATPARGNS